MDYKKIGEFIAKERKSKKLTQAKLAEKLFVSEKTISKWENGNGVPDANSLQKMCEVFGVSINEILNGEKIPVENYKQKADEKLLEMQKSKEASDKRLLNIEIVLGVITVLSFMIIFYSSIYAIHELNIYVLPIILIVVAVVMLIVGALFCFYIEQKAGYYECGKCHHKYEPTFSQSLFSPHMGRTKYMKCPNCKQKSWHKKIVNK